VRHPFVFGSHDTDTAEMPSGKYRPAESAKSLALIGTLHQKSYEAELYQICKGKGMQYQKDQITLGPEVSLFFEDISNCHNLENESFA
jgi:hypothetical protein